MRARIFAIIEADKDDDFFSKAYDFLMMFCIIITIIPLTTHKEHPIFFIVDQIGVTIFIIDYLLRLWTADLKLKRGVSSFFLYPFSFMALVDLISILPSLSIVNRGFRVLRVLRLFRTFKVFRIFKMFRYSKNMTIILNVLRKQADSLIAVWFLASGYVIVTALVMFNAEPGTFDNFFEAIYWATISLTTVGYGDIYAVSTMGQVITMVSAVFGIAIVALPAGIITAGYMKEIGVSTIGKI